MITFFLSIVLLFTGYFFYGKLVDRIFGIQPHRVTPAYEFSDGVDYVPMNVWRVFLIQVINIAGIGPIFGAIMGAMYGPAAFLWIVFGSIFGGAVHDYFSGMLSVRNRGMSFPEIVGKYMGAGFKQVMRVFTVILLVLVGTVFVSAPARLLADLTPDFLNFKVWSVIIFIYFVIATLIPIDKLIGKLYPFFGFATLFMAVSIGVAMIWNGAPIPEVVPANLHNMHQNSETFPLFPMLFISIACGAISGFHSTQSPLMARCLKNEREGRRVFYGAMVAEAIIALIWAAAAMSFFGSVGGLQEFIKSNSNSAAVVVNKIAYTWIGTLGGLLVVIGVIIAPISSGDTAFRAARLIIADFINSNQKRLWRRIVIATPLFVAALILLQINFDIIWRYFAWSNQTLASITLWTATIYLVRKKKFYWITLIPALVMTMVTSTYIVVAPEMLQLPIKFGYPAGTIFTIIIWVVFIRWKRHIAKD